MAEKLEPILFDSPEAEKVLERYQNSTVNTREVAKQWSSLLDTTQKESDVQEFLEKNPFMLPGLMDFHNGAIHDVIVTKFPFGSDYVPDFAFITWNSMMWQFTFIEIESPHKKIFTSKFSFTSHFNQAMQQIKDWNIWCKQNTESIINTYLPLTENYRPEQELNCFKFYLIYGRRSDTKQSQRAKERWSGVQASLDQDIQVMTYDRLTSFLEKLDSSIRPRYITCAYKKRGFYFKDELYRNI